MYKNLCSRSFLKKILTWTNYGEFKHFNAYRWSLDILTLNLREYRFQTKGDQYGIEGVTRYQHRDRFYFSNNWSEGKRMRRIVKMIIQI